MAGRVAFLGNIVQDDSLLLLLDAGKVKSYPRSGNVWYDLSPNRLNATIYNGPLHVSDVPEVDGRRGCLNFVSGSRHYATGSIPAAYQSSVTYSFNVWARLTTRTGYFFSCVGPAWYPQHFIGGFLQPLQFNDVFEPTAVDGGYPQSAPLGAWFNFCGVQTATQQKVYVNGVRRRTLTAPSINIYTLGHTYYVGARGVSGPSNFLNGRIGAVSVYTKSLTDAEVLQNFNALRGRYGI